MQAVILAAGRGTRMGHLTKTLPKPLLEVSGKTLLEHKFDALPERIDEIILVIGYLGDMIKKRFGDSYEGKKITYVEQGPAHGTAGALWSAREFLRDKFIVMMGDDLYGKKDVERACRSNTWLMFAMELPQLHGGGKI
ncbi:MAG: nucleotidyltransferase family protein, partial [Patescibacteria group bacterium]